MSEHINLQGVVSKSWTGSSAIIRGLGYALIALGLLGSIDGLLSMVDVSVVTILAPSNSGLALGGGVMLLALAAVTALINEIFDANHTIVD